MYVFAAVSKDGKYFVWFLTDVDYLNPPPELFKLSDQQMTQFDDGHKSWESFQSRVRKGLTDASPKSFKPDLDQLDAVMRSLELR
jgi:hypothetical protein